MDYKEKLRLAKEALISGTFDKDTIEYIFPELKENEDERIRKWLIGYFQRNKIAENIKTHDIIAWLEKQGEQKPTIKVEPKFDQFWAGQISAFKGVIKIIDYIPEESTDEVNCIPKSDELEEEIESYFNNHQLTTRSITLMKDKIKSVAHHFAEWQKQKDQETIELAEDHAMLAGMMKEREEMMKNAVDAFVNTYENTDDSNYVEFVTEQSPYKFKELEKCKLIIIKED